jgi:hypothetical protein
VGLKLVSQGCKSFKEVVEVSPHSRQVEGVIVPQVECMCQVRGRQGE